MEYINKKTAMKFHKIAVLTNLLSDELSDINIIETEETQLMSNFKRLLNEIYPISEELITDLFKNAVALSKTSYLNNVVNQIDTVIRKNYQQIDDSIKLENFIQIKEIKYKELLDKANKLDELEKQIFEDSDADLSDIGEITCNILNIH